MQEDESASLCFSGYTMARPVAFDYPDDVAVILGNTTVKQKSMSLALDNDNENCSTTQKFYRKV